MIDLHSHILPGVDDGAADRREALAMCRLAAEDGCKVIFATPHQRHEHWWNEDRQALEDSWRRLRREAAGIIDIYLGGEIAVHSRSIDEMERLPAGGLLPLAGSRYLLLELDRHGLGPSPLDLAHELTVEGWRPIIAHPERIRWLASRPDLMAELVSAGASLQLTAMSVTGRLGPEIQRLCLSLLDDGLVDFIASDAHDGRIRPPGLSEARRWVEERLGAEAAERIFVHNPRAVLLDRPIAEPRLWPRAATS